MAVYEETLTNKLTGERVVIKSNDGLTFKSKKEKKLAQWDKLNHRLVNTQEAESRLKQASASIEAYKGVLAATLDVDDKIDWTGLIDSSSYKKFKSTPAPDRVDFFRFVPKPGFLEKIFSSFRKHRENSERDAQQKFEAALKDHENDEQKKKEKFEQEKSAFLEKQQEHNEKIESLRSAYETASASGVVTYINMVMERSEYPEGLDLFVECQFDTGSRTLVANIDLPSFDTFPLTIDCKFLASKNEIVEKRMPKKQAEDFYNDVLYQIVLRTIHEIFESDYVKAIELVVVNGWIDGVDTKTGKDFRNCLLSVQVERTEFEKIDLSRVDPRDCFKHLKGVSAGNLINLAPVKPIMLLNTNDKRFIDAANVLDDLEEQTNLAVMEWQHFEILVRDLIQKEFAREGCKVEVTRASRDAGVDAIAFDEDAIRGGKYVIQAKRYNNLVPVGAVRDLYGTVVNEGAVKGILITTSHYGKDALQFAKDKPLKLINGEELIFMFNKHGYRFRIELQKKQKAASSVNY